MLIPASGTRDNVIGIRGDGDICTLPPEYRHPLYRKCYDTGAMSVGGTVAGSMSDMAVVGAGQYRPRTRGREDGGVGNGGGGSDGGGGVYSTTGWSAI